MGGGPGGGGGGPTGCGGGATYAGFGGAGGGGCSPNLNRLRPSAGSSGTGSSDPSFTGSGSFICACPAVRAWGLDVGGFVAAGAGRNSYHSTPPANGRKSA